MNDRPFHDLGQCVLAAVAPKTSERVRMGETRRTYRAWTEYLAESRAPGWPLRFHLIRKAR